MSDEPEKKDPHRVDISNAKLIWEWLTKRGGIAIWRSVDLSNPGESVTAPYNDEFGNLKGKPGWKYDDHPERIITDPAEVVVETYKEVRRFKIAVRPGSQGMSFKLTDHSSQKVRDACKKAGEGATYEFDYGTQEAVILVPASAVPLKEWAERNVKVDHLGGKFLTKEVYVVHTDFDHVGPDPDSCYDREEDAYKAAAAIAEANYRDQRNFEQDEKVELARLWESGDYKGVVELWGEVMSQSPDHLDFIRVSASTLYTRA